MDDESTTPEVATPSGEPAADADGAGRPGANKRRRRGSRGGRGRGGRPVGDGAPLDGDDDGGDIDGADDGDDESPSPERAPVRARSPRDGAAPPSAKAPGGIDDAAAPRARRSGATAASAKAAAVDGVKVEHVVADDSAGVATAADASSPRIPAPPRRRPGRGADAADPAASADGGTAPGSPVAAVTDGGGDDPAPVARPQRATTTPPPARRDVGAGDGSTGAADPADPVELPERLAEGRPSATAGAQAVVPRRPQIGDTRPSVGDTRPAIGDTRPAPAGSAPAANQPRDAKAGDTRSGEGRGGEGKSGRQPKGPKGPKPAAAPQRPPAPATPAGGAGSERKRDRNRSKGKGGNVAPATSVLGTAAASAEERRRGRERNGRPVGRYLMAVQAREGLTQVSVLEGRSLIEHYVSRPADDVGQIHGNIYLGRVQNVLPGMEAAFVDISTPKNAVLYRGDVQYDSEDIVEKSDKLKIEQMLKSKQLIVCQVTKNPIGAKGARLTQEVSLPGRFVVLIPNSKTYGISKRLPDDERKRLRGILDRVKPAEHGLIVRTAAESASEEELRADVLRLAATWQEIATKAEQARKANQPRLLYREPELAVRVIREEFNAEYRGIVIDDRELFESVKSYIGVMNPELVDRVEFYDAAAEGLPLYEKHHIHEQLHKALDRKVWLPSGGSLIIEHTEALTVIDVNTGKNVGTSNLETTVFHNNLEAAEEIARQLRLRDIGGIIVIDFIDMEIRENRKKVVDAFRSALARDKTRSQVFDISELGLVEMTRKRIGEGMLTSFADRCPTCDGRGLVVDHRLI